MIQIGGDILTMSSFLYRWIVALTHGALCLSSLLHGRDSSLPLCIQYGYIHPMGIYDPPLHIIYTPFYVCSGYTHLTRVHFWPSILSILPQGEHKGTVARHLTRTENAWCLRRCPDEYICRAARIVFKFFSQVPRLVIPLITLAVRL
jgi:hypothetical protein